MFYWKRNYRNEHGSWGVFLKWIEKAAEGHEDKIFEIRGQGLMIGIEFHQDEIGYEVSKAMFDQGILVAGTLINSKTIRIEPSLTISYEEVDTVINTFKSVLTQVKVNLNKVICEFKRLKL